MQLQKLNPDGDDDDNGMKTKNILISANDYLNFSDTKTLNSKNSSYAQTLSSEETVYLLKIQNFQMDYYLMKFQNFLKTFFFSQGPCCNEEEEHSKSSLRDFFVVLALTFHAILEGIAVGLEPEVNDVWLLFAGELLDPDASKYIFFFSFDLLTITNFYDFYQLWQPINM